jgi:hypothetical protein
VAVAVPAARIEYIELVVSAGLDTTGRFRYVQEIAVASDAVSFLLEKAAQDAVTTPDASIRDVGKGLVDSVSFAESFSKLLIFIRNIADQTSVSDAQQRQVAKALADAVAAQDVRSFSMSKPLLDSAGLTDRVVLQAAKTILDAVLAGDVSVVNVVKPLSDTASVSDAASVATQRPVVDAASVLDASTVSASKGLFDQQQINDVARAAVDKAVADVVVLLELTTRHTDKILADAALTADQVSRLVNRFVQDGVAMNDSADLADGITFQAIKSFMNVTFAADQKQASVLKSITDTAVAADAGLLVSQGYCDLTYFAEDYVGEARIF